jgi:hypothetical protein
MEFSGLRGDFLVIPKFLLHNQCSVDFFGVACGHGSASGVRDSDSTTFYRSPCFAHKRICRPCDFLRSVRFEVVSSVGGAFPRNPTLDRAACGSIRRILLF